MAFPGTIRRRASYALDREIGESLVIATRDAEGHGWTFTIGGLDTRYRSTITTLRRRQGYHVVHVQWHRAMQPNGEANALPPLTLPRQGRVRGDLPCRFAVDGGSAWSNFHLGSGCTQGGQPLVGYGPVEASWTSAVTQVAQLIEDEKHPVRWGWEDAVRSTWGMRPNLVHFTQFLRIGPVLLFRRHLDMQD